MTCFFEETQPMVRSLCRALFVGWFVVASGVSAHGFFGYGVPMTTAYYYPDCGFPAPVPTVYYYAPPTYVVPAPACPAAVPVVAPTTPYAVPAPAPPSGPAPGAGPRQAPKVIESRSQIGQYPPVSTVANEAARDLRRVGFWNLADRDMTVTVDGQVHVLPRGRSLTLTLGRRFVWQIDEREAQEERIQEDKTTLEIVIRR
jgi:hypothetical protein